MPAVLVEAGFINNEQDNALFDERFDEIEGEISIIKEQTAKNSEMLSIIEDYGKRIYNLETDVSIIKKAMRS